MGKSGEIESAWKQTPDIPTAWLNGWSNTVPIRCWDTELRVKGRVETGEMLVREMESLGLSDVHKDRICVDSWEFEKAVMVFTDSRGREHRFQLGAYQTDFHTGGFREFSLVYLGKGTAADYRQVDVTGKLVLIDINQRDEWWINFLYTRPG